MSNAINAFLREELKDILLEAWREKHSEVVFTGEMFSTDALDIARAYERANGNGQQALRAVVESWGKAS